MVLFQKPPTVSKTQCGKNEIYRVGNVVKVVVFDVTGIKNIDNTRK